MHGQPESVQIVQKVGQVAVGTPAVGGDVLGGVPALYLPGTHLRLLLLATVWSASFRRVLSS